jgi:hypothetical protein
VNKLHSWSLTLPKVDAIGFSTPSNGVFCRARTSKVNNGPEIFENLTVENYLNFTELSIQKNSNLKITIGLTNGGFKRSSKS